jgi:single-stranded DNA-binding protein
LTKGKKVAVVGELHHRLYEDKTGKTRLSLDVEADEVEFLSPKENAETKPQKSEKQTDDLAGFTDIRSDDLPF